MKNASERVVKVTDGNQFDNIRKVLVSPADVSRSAGDFDFDQFVQF